MIGHKFGLDNVLSRCHVDDSSLKIDRPREFRDVWLMGSRCPHIYPLRDPETGSSIFCSDGATPSVYSKVGWFLASVVALSGSRFDALGFPIFPSCEAAT